MKAFYGRKKGSVLVQENKNSRKGLIIAMLAVLLIGSKFLVQRNVSVDSTDLQVEEVIALNELRWESTNKEGDNEPKVDFSAEEDIITLTNNRNRTTEFENGIQMLPDSEIIYDLSNLEFNYLTTWVGIDREMTAPGSSVQFEIFTDEELIYESKVMWQRMPMEYTTVDISGVDQLKLVVTNHGDSSERKEAAWADIQLHVDNPIERNVTDLTDYDEMKLIFSEEFDGDELDTNIWNTLPWPENGTHHYANAYGQDENLWVEDGNLIIQAKPYEGNQDYSTTSAHIVTHGNFDFRYGRVDVRAKIPTETGMWPAIWMMASKQDYQWPMEGEIDIMELVSQEPDRLYSTVHSGIAGGNNYHTVGDTYQIDQGTFFDNYHVYSLVWEPGALRFYVDDELIEEQTDWKNWILDGSDEIVERAFPIPFDKDFHIKLNLATGGWSKDVDETTRFGERTRMLVDYVRVYQDETPAYNYFEDEPFSNRKQGAVWYTQRDNDGTWENLEQFDAETMTWVSAESGVIGDENDSAFIALNSISANFDPESIYNAASIAFRAPYSGFVKVSIDGEVELEKESEVAFKITKGNSSTTKSDNLFSETISNEMTNLSGNETYLQVDADEMIRFEILKSDNTVHNFNPIVQYLTEEEFNEAIN